MELRDDGSLGPVLDDRDRVALAALLAIVEGRVAQGIGVPSDPVAARELAMHAYHVVDAFVAYRLYGLARTDLGDGCARAEADPGV